MVKANAHALANVNGFMRGKSYDFREPKAIGIHVLAVMGQHTLIATFGWPGESPPSKPLGAH